LFIGEIEREMRNILIGQLKTKLLLKYLFPLGNGLTSAVSYQRSFQMQGESLFGRSILKDGKRLEKGGDELHKLNNITKTLEDSSNSWGYSMSERERIPPGLTRSAEPSLQLPEGNKQ